MQESHKSADLRAQFILLKGAALKFLGRREEALQLFGTIKPLEPLVVDVCPASAPCTGGGAVPSLMHVSPAHAGRGGCQERYTIPFTYYEVGEIEYHRGHVPEAEAAFRYVANFGGVYDVRGPPPLVAARVKRGPSHTDPIWCAVLGVHAAASFRMCCATASICALPTSTRSASRPPLCRQ